MTEKKKLSKDEKKLMREIFWNSFMLEASYNYERQQALGFAIGMWPAIKRYHKTKEAQAEALTRHMSIFNTTPHVVTTITGVATALEKEASEKPSFDKSIINNVKVGLMGPFAGIGDSLFWGTIRIIAVGIGLSLAQQGSILGPILFLLLFNIPHMLVRYYGGVFGYKFGTSIMQTADNSGIMAMISKGATIVGLMVIGGMTASMVKLKSTLVFSVGETEFPMQDYLDQIFPMLLPLLYTLFMFRLLKKGYKSTTILLITIIFGIVGSLIGII
ncbi:PTS system mannose/fructose/sorbose family transporter subunit IID [Bacillus sp. FJAT-50079]|uniref:PTS system mannose/fructose/sorbose family transporter subunit IID n=1 Tax=Bacillus sp. FJAT-50079 TaxID=2833577 RepID=UPI001BC99A0F|nr:PTS system mannose/fructose/sorbose family transporter subunit IID [Bacillus sp. FJAT-50079]MBS4206562.1 PTS system mannose/fructose/sorbose family transporter subunit IID [Bacillus sp. FJAT-50079]